MPTTDARAATGAATATSSQVLKCDLFGTVTLERRPEGPVVVRDLASARPWLRWLARHLASRERRALQRLESVPGLRGKVPRVLSADRNRIEREWIEAAPMQRARPTDPRYFREALRLVRRLHAARVLHNDLAKEPNWLVTPEGSPALVDFQLAHCAGARGHRGPVFRALAHDDLRHLLKHKRNYAAERLSARQRAVLARPSLISRAWMAGGKRVYLFVTRRLLRWQDREGAGDRSF